MGWKRRVRSPTVLQMEAAECGAASLGMILGYFGSYVPLQQLRVDCGISRDGSKASYILKAARKYGLVAKGYKKEIDQLPELKLPAILFWDFNHFVVLDEIKKDSYVLNDPASGRRIVSKSDFEKSFTGVTLEFEKGKDYEAIGSRPSVWQPIKKTLLTVPSALIFMALWGLLLTVLQMTRPATLRMLVDDWIIHRHTATVQPLILFVLLSVLVMGTLMILRGVWMMRFGTRLLWSSSDLVWRILRLPMGFFSSRYVGDVTDRVQGHVAISQMMSMQIPQMVLSLGILILFLTALFRFDWVLAITCVLAISTYVVMIKWLAQQRGQLVEKEATEKSHATSAMIAGLYTIEALKASASESDFFTRMTGLRAKSSNAYVKSIWLNALIDALPNFLMMTTIAITLMVASLRVMKGDITIGMLVACEVLALFLLDPMSKVSQVFQQVAQLNFYQARLDDVETQPIKTLPEGEGFPLKIVQLSFAYDRFSPPTIEGFSLEVKAGQRIALVGSTGSGKSTIAKLICGLYEPSSGEIICDRKNLAYVEQDIYLFAGRVIDNLTLWDSTVPMDDVIRAAKDAQIHEQIMQTLGGYEGLIEEGGRNLSGGEVQRLEIARALIRNPSILVLDECMSALDPITEQLIDQNLKQRGCTCIMVAHRLSTIRDCDEIMVLEAGHIVQRGTHDELMAQGGRYEELVAHQA